MCSEKLHSGLTQEAIGAAGEGKNARYRRCVEAIAHGDDGGVDDLGIRIIERLLKS